MYRKKKKNIERRKNVLREKKSGIRSENNDKYFGTKF